MARIYVSSTLGDLQEYRRAVRDSIAAAGQDAIGIEVFAASPESPTAACQSAIQHCDLMVLVIARRYGALLPGENVSVTEFEFNTAQRFNIPILAFILNEDYPWPSAQIDTGSSLEQLEAFKGRIKASVTPEKFGSSSDLGVRVLRALKNRYLAADTRPPASAPPLLSRSDEFAIKVEDHLNFLRSAVGELHDKINRQHLVHTQQSGQTCPAAFLGNEATEVDRDLCFVAMPYSREWSDPLQEILVEICKSVHMKLLIAKNMDGRLVAHDIWKGITAAAVVIADITDGNPNVAYEVGLADVLGKEVVLLCQGDKVPFDFSGQRLIQYQDSMKGTMLLREELTARLQRIRDNANADKGSS